MNITKQRAEKKIDSRDDFIRGELTGKHSKHELIKRFPDSESWFNEMPEDVFSQGKLKTYESGALVSSIGSPLKYVFILLKGKASIQGNSVSGKTMNVTILEKGSLIGEMETILKQDRYTFSVKAYSDLWTFVMPCSVFHSWIEQDDRLCRKLVWIMAEKLSQSSSVSVRYNSWDADTRVRLFLANLGTGKVNYTRADIAEACGISSRTVYRVINHLLLNQYISIRHGKIYIDQNQCQKLRDTLDVL